MRIDFEKMDEAVMPRFKGGEKAFAAKITDDGVNRILLGRLEPGASIGRHTHETDSETVYVLSGRGTMYYDDTAEPLSAGIAHYCPPGHAHSFVNDGDADLVFFAIVPRHG